MTAIEDENWFAGSGDRTDVPVPAERSVLRCSTTTVWKDADGNPLETTEEDGAWPTISEASLGPVLTMDWDCHRQASLGTWSGEATASDRDRTLVSGSTAVVFSVKHNGGQ